MRDEKGLSQDRGSGPSRGESWDGRLEDSFRRLGAGRALVVWQLSVLQDLSSKRTELWQDQGRDSSLSEKQGPGAESGAWGPKDEAEAATCMWS